MGRSFTAVLLFGVFSHSKNRIVAQFVKFLYEMFGFCKYSSDKFKMVIQRASPLYLCRGVLYSSVIRKEIVSAKLLKRLHLSTVYFFKYTSTFMPTL